MEEVNPPIEPSLRVMTFDELTDHLMNTMGFNRYALDPKSYDHPETVKFIRRGLTPLSPK